MTFINSSFKLTISRPNDIFPEKYRLPELQAELQRKLAARKAQKMRQVKSPGPRSSRTSADTGDPPTLRRSDTAAFRFASSMREHAASPASSAHGPTSLIGTPSAHHPNTIPDDTSEWQRGFADLEARMSAFKVTQHNEDNKRDRDEIPKDPPFPRQYSSRLGSPTGGLGLRAGSAHLSPPTSLSASVPLSAASSHATRDEGQLLDEK